MWSCSAAVGRQVGGDGASEQGLAGAQVTRKAQLQRLNQLLLRRLLHITAGQQLVQRLKQGTVRRRAVCGRRSSGKHTACARPTRREGCAAAGVVAACRQC